MHVGMNRSCAVILNDSKGVPMHVGMTDPHNLHRVSYREFPMQWDEPETKRFKTLKSGVPLHVGMNRLMKLL